MANKHVKILSMLLINKEIQIKSTLRYYILSPGMGIIKNQ